MLLTMSCNPLAISVCVVLRVEWKRFQRTPALQLWKRFVEEGVSTKDGISLKA